MGDSGYFVTGIGTDVGKTIVSMLLAEYLQIPYWKPIQTGDILDAHIIHNYKPNIEIIPSAYTLDLPAAPLFADKNHIISIDYLSNLPLETSLIIEGAGGILVPVTKEISISNLILQWQLPVVLVARNYLGYINHTLLSIHYLLSKNIPIAAVVINEALNDNTEDFIQQQYPDILFFRIPHIEDMTTYNYNFYGL